MHSAQVLLIATGLAAAGVVFAQSFTVNTPTALFFCQPTQISWSGGTPPYFPRITQGGNTADVLKTFPKQDSNSVTWIVDVPAGQSITVNIGDSSGLSQSSAQVTVQSSGSTTCNAEAGPSSTSAVAGATSSSRPASSSSAASSTARSGTTSNSASATHSTSTSTPTGDHNNSAAGVRGYSAVVAGLVGVAAAALL